MKNPTSILFIISLAVMSCTPSPKNNQTELIVTFINSHPSQYNCLAQADAEKILGQPAQRMESTKEEKGSVLRHACTYTATYADPMTNKLGNLYYLFEQYPDDASAHKAYADILSSNAGPAGQTKIESMGDEAWWHSDEENFQLIMFRKQNKMVRVKINKVTSLTSASALKAIVQDIALNI